jgi:hypothetical protein
MGLPRAPDTPPVGGLSRPNGSWPTRSRPSAVTSGGGAWPVQFREAMKSGRRGSSVMDIGDVAFDRLVLGQRFHTLEILANFRFAAKRFDVLHASPSSRFRGSAVIGGTSRDERVSRESSCGCSPNTPTLRRQSTASGRRRRRTRRSAGSPRWEHGSTWRTRQRIPSCSSMRSRIPPPCGFSFRTCPPRCARSPSPIAGKRSRRGSPRTAGCGR